MAPSRSRVFRFVIMVGVVNLWADLTYEGARSITGPFLAQLGATAAVISIVSGSAEFFGYAFRAVSGYFADKSKRYWTCTFAGYAINLLAVPALALAGSWPAAAGFMSAERTGRAIRRPIVQSMLSHAKDTLGGGLAFGINESMDAVGATIGPLLVAAVIALGGDYRRGFAVLLVSALLCLGTLTIVHRQFPHPQTFETAGPRSSASFPQSYWLFLAGGGLVGFGFVDFSLIAFHFQRTGTVAGALVPITYASAMGAGAIGNLVLGRAYDRVGLPLLIGALVVGSSFTPLVFLVGSPIVAFVGMAFWGLNKGVQDTLFKPLIAPLVAPSRRSTAFGIFDTSFGACWLAGSITFGLLYDKSLWLLVLLSVVTQLLAVPLFVLGQGANRRHRTTEWEG